MIPHGLRLAYRTDDGSLTTLERTGFSSFGCQDFALSVEWMGEELALAIEAIARIELTELVVTFAHDFTREGILMNGYQSWTDTREYSALSTMPGLTRAPKAVIDRFVLDGGGDYPLPRGILACDGGTYDRESVRFGTAGCECYLGRKTS